MNRTFDPEKINLSITGVIYFVNGLQIKWSSDIGWGEWSIYVKDGVTRIESGGMDDESDRAFTRALLKRLADVPAEVH